MKIFSILILAASLSAAQPVWANAAKDDILKRIADAQVLVADHDQRSVDEIYRELKNSASAEGNLKIYEAIAATYRDLGAELAIEGKTDARKLYDQIRMNVAYLQFGGDPDAKGRNKINRWIRQTLMKYLADDMITNKAIFHSADEWRSP